MNQTQYRIIYFSGTGNTAYVGNKIKANLSANGYEVDSVPMELVKPEELSGFACLYLGFPIYGCDMPAFVRKFIRRMPEGGGSMVKLFSTKAYFSGKAMIRSAELLHSKGYSVGTFFEAKMPGSDGLAFLKKNGAAALKLLGNPDLDLPGLDRWVNQYGLIDLRRRFPDITGRIFGALMKLFENALRGKFHADSRCTLCGKCVKICPVNNIRIEDQMIRFNEKCMLCMRCIHNCPPEAIQIGRGTINKYRYHGPEGDFRPPKITVLPHDSN